ncbi:hypothetical protein JHK84_054064 [Glycine max]|nr:hypothetical protein JHK84_054064 [Glycine max]
MTEKCDREKTSPYSDISRLLSYVEGKLKGFRVKTGFSEQQLSPKPSRPQVSCPLQNDVDSWATIDEQGDVDMVLPPNNFGGLINESSLGFGVLPRDDF